MVSVIIPTYNEAKVIEDLVWFLKANAGIYDTEIIVSDGGSTDKTIELAENAGATVLKCSQKGRASQMNFGASKSTGSILYFVHADCIPPKGFAKDIMDAVNAGYDVGRYQTKFISTNLLLKINAFFTRFDMFSCYGGDQTLFITKDLFTKLNGYDVSKLIMEDYDITSRAKEKARYMIFNRSVLVSARKYELNSWLRVQKANYKAVQQYKKGISTQQIANTYKKMLHL